MDAFNPMKHQGIQAKSEGANIAQLTNLQALGLNDLSKATSKMGQDLRSQEAMKIIGSGKLKDMPANEARAYLLANTQGSLNEGATKSIDALLGLKQDEEQAEVKQENALETLGIEINADLIKEDAKNLVDTDNNKRTNATSRRNTDEQVKSLLNIQKLKEQAHLERLLAQPYAGIGGNAFINKTTGDLYGISGNGQDGQGSGSGYLSIQDFGKTLTGNQKDFYADLEDNDKLIMQKIKQVNPRFNITPVMKMVGKTNKRVGWKVSDGSGFEGTLGDVYQRLKDYRKLRAKKLKQSAEATRTPVSPVTQKKAATPVKAEGLKNLMNGPTAIKGMKYDILQKKYVAHN